MPPRFQVLFIDDDPSVQLLAEHMLANGIFRVIGAANPADADEVLNREKIDLIICDVMMPSEDGVSFCKRLRKRGNHLPILMLSAVSQPDTQRKAMESGANGYLVKPFDIQELERRMTALVMPKQAPTKKTNSSPDRPKSWFSRVLKKAS